MFPIFYFLGWASWNIWLSIHELMQRKWEKKRETKKKKDLQIPLTNSTHFQMDIAFNLPSLIYLMKFLICVCYDAVWLHCIHLHAFEWISGKAQKCTKMKTNREAHRIGVFEFVAWYSIVSIEWIFFSQKISNEFWLASMSNTMCKMNQRC